jgi:hypothetical protein
VPWAHHDPARDERQFKVRAPRPDDCTAEEFEARLHAETDRSLRQDPARWVIGSASTGASSLSRSGVGDGRSPSPYSRHPDPARRREPRPGRDRARARDKADVDAVRARDDSRPRHPDDDRWF